MTREPTPTAPIPLTTSTAAQRLQRSEATVRAMAIRGELAVLATLPDGTRLFDPQEVERVAQKLRAAP